MKSFSKILGVLLLLAVINCEAKKKPQRKFWGRNWQDGDAGTIDIDNREGLQGSGDGSSADLTHFDDEDEDFDDPDFLDAVVISGDHHPDEFEETIHNVHHIDNEGDDDDNDDDDLQGSGSGTGIVPPEPVVTKPIDTVTTEKTTTAKTKALTPCQQLRTSSLNLSLYTPRCKENGDYEKLQCSGKPMHRTCWCVNPKGLEISGTMKENDEPDCDFESTKAPVATQKPHQKGKTPKKHLPDGTGYVISTEKPVDENIVVEINHDNNAIPIDSDEEDDPEIMEENTNEINDETDSQPQTAATAQLLLQPGLLAAVIGSAVVGLLCIILLIMFIVYRMRKKDAGSYALEEQKYHNYTYTKAPEKEFYA